MYDITDRASFLNTDEWVEAVRSKLGVRSERGDGVFIVLVGNKTDLSDRRCARL